MLEKYFIKHGFIFFSRLSIPFTLYANSYCTVNNAGVGISSSGTKRQKAGDLTLFLKSRRTDSNGI